MFYTFSCNATNVSKPIVVFFLVFNFYELYILFCIKDILTACSPLGDLSAHTRKKNLVSQEVREFIWKEMKTQTRA